MSAEGQKLLIPGVCRIEHAYLTNYAGDVIDIRGQISEIKVTESINSMFCIYELVIVDAASVLQEYAISGNEKIELELSKRDLPDSEDVYTTKYLTLTGIKEYGRATNESQVYVIQAVSETALRCTAERVSKSVNGSISKIIDDLYKEVEYKLPLEVIEKTEGNYKIVLPNYTVTKTLIMLLGRAQNAAGTTFNLFEKLWGDVTLTSYDKILSGTPIDTYYLSQSEGKTDNTSDFEDARKKIKEISSILGVSHFESFRKGGINNRVFMNDIATKSISKTDYFLLEENVKKFEPDHILSDTYQLAGKNISDIKQSNTIMVNKNTLAYGSAPFSAGNLQNKVDETIALKKFHFENQYAVSHNIRLVGDSRLAAGSIIEIDIPTPSDPKFLPPEITDEYFSGKYFVSTVVHTINMGGAYTVDLSIRKNSIDRNKMTSKYKSIE